MKDIQISLKAARINAGLTLVDAAKKIGIGKDTLLKWERRPELVNPLFQSRISEAYDFPIDYIFFGR
nr:MAG TPA: Helix-turn-helix XRE-family like protein [Caudoviricetes sp.]